MFGNYLETPPANVMSKKQSRDLRPPSKKASFQALMVDTQVFHLFKQKKALQVQQLQQRVQSMEQRLSSLNQSGQDTTILSHIKSCKMRQNLVEKSSPRNPVVTLFSSEKKTKKHSHKPPSGVNDMESLKRKLDHCQYLSSNQSHLSRSANKIDPNFATKKAYDGQSSILEQLQLMLDRIQKYRRTRNADEDAVQIAKFKWSYCESNYEFCFDFYRCNDPVILKYLCYELYRELEQQESQNRQKSYKIKSNIQDDYSSIKHNNSFDISRTQRLIGEVEAYLEEVMDELRKIPNLKHTLGNIENFSENFRKIRSELTSNWACHSRRNNSGVSIFETSKKYDGIKRHINQIELEFKELDIDRSELSVEKNHLLQKLKDYKDLNKQLQQQLKDYRSEHDQYQTQVNNHANQIVSTLKEKIQTLQDELNQRKQQGQEDKSNCVKARDELEKFQREYLSMSERVQEINRNFDQIQDQYQISQSENEDLRKKIFNYQQEIKALQMQVDIALHRQNQANQEEMLNLLKSVESKNKIIHELQNLQNSSQAQNETLVREIDLIKQEALQKAQNDYYEIRTLAEQILNYQKLLQLSTSEATYLGQVAVYASDILLRHNQEELPATLVLLQKDLAQKKVMVMNKMQILRKIQDNQFEDISNEEETYDHTTHTAHNFQEINLLENLQSNRSADHLLSCGLTQIQSVSGNASTMQNKSTAQSENDLYCTLLIQCSTIEKLLK